ncbi:MAG: DEAD/DEAH box helicase family protein [Bacteroidales bacterium]|nr:DEAD/DEAH box helicase family protein [Bacteroidales bacterium]
MKFRFKIQQYQTDAVERTVGVFAGQPAKTEMAYRMDTGKQTSLDDIGYRNSDIELSNAELLDNIRHAQRKGDIPISNSLVIDSGLGRCSLDIEMETGTGKTYVYIKTMFELNRRYGWNKYIVVVPSVAIREGVMKSFSQLEEHFMEHYGKKARYFVYNSSNLYQIDQYSSSADLNCMIINMQAFNTSMREGAANKESRIIYSERDDFGSRRPIDVLAANRPIIIMDEPQKMEGEATRKALKNFRPLFVLNYSATHKTQHNQVYALDALDAYRQRLVKKIEVKGVEVKNLPGTTGYLYLDNIVLSKNKAPEARIGMEVKTASGIRRMVKAVGVKDDVYIASNNAQEYKEGYIITDIDVATHSITFLNGKKMSIGQVVGDTNEMTIQRIQLRETIKSHLRKECQLFEKGIKALSLFFIDEVEHYKYYDDEGEQQGYLAKFFEEEYKNALAETLTLFPGRYQDYLRRWDAHEVHKGYFSIDKKGHAVNSSMSKKSDISDDISAYDLILKNKERLLSFEEPTRFIFSHSALREGWDNPNVFQICTLRHANSSVAKRQEVGRGLRICVDKDGNRMDSETLGEDMFGINKLTVIANESYKNFVADLQRDIRADLRERPLKAVDEYFEGKTIVDADGEKTVIDQMMANRIMVYLDDNGYIDKDHNITPLYRQQVAEGKTAPMSTKLQPYEASIHQLVQAIFDPTMLDNMVEDANKVLTPANRLNDNFAKEEFQKLWKQINYQYVYTVHYDSRELVDNVVNAINHNLHVSQMRYVVTRGEQQEQVDQFKVEESDNLMTGTVSTTTAKYDLVGDIARGATLTRRTVVEILRRTADKLPLYQNNPEGYIHEVVRIIKEQKATMIVESITYNRTEGKYDSDIFTTERHHTIDGAIAVKKNITDYLFTDSKGERQFAEALDIANEVCVYARLPRSFHIPTPVGNYAPDWAIAFNEGNVKYVYFIAETKGSMDDMELRGIEKSKTDCAAKLFDQLSNGNVHYGVVDSYEKLRDLVMK